MLEFRPFQGAEALVLEFRPFQGAEALLQALEVALTALLEAQVSPKEVVAFVPLAAERLVARLEAQVSQLARAAEEVLRLELHLEIRQLLSSILLPLALLVLIFLLRREVLLLLRRLDLCCFLMAALVLVLHYLILIQRPVLVPFEEEELLVLRVVVRLQELVVRCQAAAFQGAGSLEELVY